MKSTQLRAFLISAAALIAILSTACSRTTPSSSASGSEIVLADASQASGQPAYAVPVDGTAELAKYGKKRVIKGSMPKHPAEAWDDFMRRRAVIGTNYVPPTYREEAWKFARANTTRANMAEIGLKAVTPQWTLVGPKRRSDYPVGARGRIIDIAIAPGNENTIYVGTASGGVWKTTNGGQDWTPLTDEIFPSLGIGSVELAPGSADLIYAGLSEGMTSFWFEPLGAGIYRSANGGAAWELVPGTGNFFVVTDIEFGSSANTIYSGTLGYSTSGGQIGAGFHKSTNGGANWTTTKTDPCREVTVNPTNDQHLAGSFEINGTASLFWSENGGDTWTPATQPSAPNAARIELARSPSAPLTLYALVGNNDSKLGGIWKSTDGGKNWSAQSQTGVLTGEDAPGQMTYNNCIAVKPDNPDVVYFGTNLAAYKSTNGGGAWNAITYWYPNNPLQLPDIHADHHAIAFGNSADTVFYCTDGGLYKSTNGGTSWTEINGDMVCTQIYRMSNDPNDPNYIMIGTQDNACFFRKRNGDWIYNAFLGDGMEVIIDPDNPCYAYKANYFGSTMVFTNNYAESDNIGDGTWFNLRSGLPAGSENDQGAWVIPMWLDPKDSSKLYCVLQDVYRATVTKQCHPTAPPFISFEKIVDLDGSGQRVETAAMTLGSSNRKIFLFTARFNGVSVSLGLRRIDVANPASVDVLQLPRLGFITSIACDPQNNDTVYVGYSDLFFDPKASVPRIYKSTSLGNNGSWVDITNNFPSSTPVNALFIDPANSSTILAGTDTGIYRTDDGGANWYLFSDGLPNTTVSDFDFVTNGRILRAATYGRGLWETPLDGGQAGTPTIRVEPKNLSYP